MLISTNLQGRVSGLIGSSTVKKSSATIQKDLRNLTENSKPGGG